MKRNIRTVISGVVVLACALSAPGASSSEQELDIDRLSGVKAIPVSISGFSAEVKSILEHDLIFMGFKNVSEAEAKYLITGANANRVEGRLIERINRNQILGKAYSGGPIRAQTHAFADDIAVALGRGPGIAQTQITYKVETGGGNSEIYVADYDGHNARRVTKDGSLVVAPCWAGRSMLAYTSYKLGAPVIFSHHLSSGARRTVARYPGSNISPAVSPDGRLVAMILSKGGSPDLYVSNIDGSGLRQLTRTRAEESSPCWSPDNRTICYVSKSTGVNELYSISSGGGQPRRIKTAGVINPTEPDWSPDGKWIVFTSMMRDFNICVVPSSGGTVKVLVLGEDPTWAANSRAVIFCKGPDHGKRLSLLDVPTKQIKDIARILESNSQPSWAK